MANLTIAIDDALLREARIKAVQQGTSVNEVCRQAVEKFVRGERSDAAERFARIKAIADRVAPAPVSGPVWPGREAFYEEVLRERGLIRDDEAAPPAADDGR